MLKSMFKLSLIDIILFIIFTWNVNSITKSTIIFKPKYIIDSIKKLSKVPCSITFITLLLK